MKRFPDQLEEMLSPHGRRVLAGKDPLAGVLQRDGLVVVPDMLAPKQAASVAKILHGAFADLIVPQRKPVPKAADSSIFTAQEKLPKSFSLLSAEMGKTVEAPMFKRATECGLVAMFQSASFKRFAEVLAGERLFGPFEMQVQCNRGGDYAGPHTDHIPQNRFACDGYIDVHFTFCTPGVKRQLIVYEQNDFLDGVRDINTVGGMTAYRLPRWHYTTPLEVTKASARRWVTMNTFTYLSKMAD